MLQISGTCLVADKCRWSRQRSVFSSRIDFRRTSVYNNGIIKRGPMIYSDLKNGGYYAAADEKIALCLAYAPSLSKDTPCGRYVLSDDVYVNVMSYDPKPVEEAVAETHRVYADLQLILDGEEWMGCADIAAMTPLSAYDEQKDIALWKQKDIPLLPMHI